MGPASDLPVLRTSAIVVRPLVDFFALLLDVMVKAKSGALVQTVGCLVGFLCALVRPKFCLCRVVLPAIKEKDVSRQIVKRVDSEAGSEVVVLVSVRPFLGRAAVLSPKWGPHMDYNITVPQLVCCYPSCVNTAPVFVRLEVVSYKINNLN
jgi:hypothetical protein